MRIIFVLLFQCLPSLGQVTFSQPTTGQVLQGGVPFLVSMSEAETVPYLSQMTGFSLQLMIGSYASPRTIFSWNISAEASPAVISNSVTIPQDIGPTATSAYFLGCSGSLIANSSISMTYFSPIFTLQNMTGASSLAITSSTISSTSTVTSAAATTSKALASGRTISCISADGTVVQGETGDGQVSNVACENLALSILSVLSSQTHTLTVLTTTSVTSPPAASGYGTSTLSSNSAASTGASVSSSTSSSPVLSAFATSIQTSQSNTSNNGISSETQSPKMIFIIIISIISLATVVALFWIWMCYRRRKYNSGDGECNLTKRAKMSRFLHRLVFGWGNGSHWGDNVEIPREKRWVGQEEQTRRYVLGSEVSRRVLGDGLPASRGSVLPGAQSLDVTKEATQTPRISTSRKGESREEPRGHGRGDSESAILKWVEQVNTPPPKTHIRKSSRKTALVELEGDLGSCSRVSLDRPLPPFIPEIRLQDITNGTSSLPSTTEGKFGVAPDGRTGTVIKAKAAATIIGVRSKKPLPISPTSPRIDDAENELAAFPAGVGMLVIEGIKVEEVDDSVKEKEEGEKAREVREARKMEKRKMRDRAGSEGKDLLGES